MKNLKELKKEFEKEFLEDDLGNNFAFVNKDNKVLINYEELWSWITKNFCPVEPEVKPANQSWTIDVDGNPLLFTFYCKIDDWVVIQWDGERPRIIPIEEFNKTIKKYGLSV